MTQPPEVKWIAVSWAIEFEGRVVMMSPLQEAILRTLIASRLNLARLATACATNKNTAAVELFHLRKKLREAGLDIKTHRRPLADGGPVYEFTRL